MTITENLSLTERTLIRQMFEEGEEENKHMDTKFIGTTSDIAETFIF